MAKKKQPTKPKKTEAVTFRVDPETLQKIDEAAEEDDRTRSYTIGKLIKAALNTEQGR